jgi:hypothetical protein
VARSAAGPGWPTIFSSLRAHPELVALGLVLLVAALVRAAFGFRIPAFVTKDSIEYVEPALSLVFGGPFELAQRRTPVYPLFMAAAFRVFGQDLLGVTFAQHLLGVLTAGLAYAIGRLTFGRAAGLLGGLLTGLSSPLLIYEHYLIAESVFVFGVITAIALFVAGLRHERWGLIALGGLVLGLAALTRPVGQVIMAVLPLAFLLHYRAWRPMLKAFALALACFALVVVPWAVRNQVVYGTAGAASIGRFLISRSVKHERNFVFYQADVGAYPGESAQRARARAIAQEVTDKRPEPGQIFQRVRDELRLTESQTDAMLKDIALEAILRDPMLWVDGTIGMFFALIEGAPKEELVHWHWEVHDQPRVSNQWGRLNYLLAPLSESQTREMGRAESLAMIFRPSQHTGVLVVLFLVGSAFAVVRRPLSPVILPALVVVVLIAGSAALVGDVPRYRYPIDPLIYVIAAGGLTSLVGMLAAGVRRLSRKQLSFGGGVASQPAK